MKFTLPINYERERRSYEQYYHYLNSKKKSKAIIWLFLGIMYLLIGFFMYDILALWGDKTNIDRVRTLFLSLGGLQTILYSYYLIHTLPNQRKKYFEGIDRQYRIFANSNVTEYTFELNEDNFILTDRLNTIKISWGTADSYQLLDDMLLLHMSKGNGAFYLFGKQEFDPGDFKSIVNFVSTKLKERKK